MTHASHTVHQHQLDQHLDRIDAAKFDVIVAARYVHEIRNKAAVSLSEQFAAFGALAQAIEKLDRECARDLRQAL